MVKKELSLGELAFKKKKKINSDLKIIWRKNFLIGDGLNVKRGPKETNVKKKKLIILRSPFTRIESHKVWKGFFAFCVCPTFLESCVQNYYCLSQNFSLLFYLFFLQLSVCQTFDKLNQLK